MDENYQTSHNGNAVAHGDVWIEEWAEIYPKAFEKLREKMLENLDADFKKVFFGSE